MTDSPEPHAPPSAPGALSRRRAAERRKRLWFNLASWATTLLLILGVGAIVRWRLRSVLSGDRRSWQAEAELGLVLRDYRDAPHELARAAARLQAIVAAYPGTEAARKAQTELERIERARGVQDAEKFGLDKP